MGHIGKSGLRDSREKHPFQSLNGRVAPLQSFAIVRRKSRETRLTGTFMASDYKPGNMDISQHKKTYHGFLVGSKWTFILCLGIMVFLAIFRTN
jgi:hypothetical protein